MAFLLLIVFLLTSSIFEIICAVKEVPSEIVEALTGETAYLPCNVSTYYGDEVVLILWYREDKGTPVYSVDVREGYTKAVKRWSDETVFGGRAYFIFDKNPGTLSIQSTRLEDSGLYRCRVDFLKAQTLNVQILLSVIAPAEMVIIRDDSGIERSTVVGPYSEGDTVIFKCEAIGGKPQPKVIWYRDSDVIESHVDFVPDKRHVESKVSLGPLRRSDLNTRITCKANNHPRAAAVESVVQIDMNFAPLSIRLLGAHQPLSEGRRYDLLCQSSGSRPPAVITWWLDGVRLEKTTETTTSDGNQTTSTLSITFSRKDAGKSLICKAYNRAVHSQPLEDGWRLDIQYIPEAYVKLGASLDRNSIKEGTDVYFDCMVLAHPSVFRIEWRHNGNPLPHNISQGVILTNHSLVLQGVTRFTAGNFSCVAYNIEGEGHSDPYVLNVLYTPICLHRQKIIYGVAKKESAIINCSVEANPRDVEFSWTFNNSAENIDVAKNHVAKYGTSSIVTYTPMTELDYGTLLCVATNKIGKQRIPCVFHIIAAGRPDQVYNCTLTNISMTSLTVTCTDGFNGGLSQLFILELVDNQSNEIKANITSTLPRFTVSTLSPGGLYTLSVYAFNSKGRSDPTVLYAAMLKMPEKQLTYGSGDKSRTDVISPMVSLTAGLTLSVLVAGLAIILVLRIPCQSSKRQQKEFSNEQHTQNLSPELSEKSSGSNDIEEIEDDKNPDIVPETIDTDAQVDFITPKQLISTIESNCCPSTNLLKNTSPPLRYTTFHSPYNTGFCTIRSGLQSSSVVETMSMNIAPQVLSSSISQLSLPPNAHHHLRPNYNTVLYTSRHMLHRQTLPSSSSNMGQIGAFSEYIKSATAKKEEHAQVRQNRSYIGITHNVAHTTEPICVSHEEVTAQTPLMKTENSL